jgi:uncharacterized membrane protein YdjX (TVP38/TMEM64 family)
MNLKKYKHELEIIALVIVLFVIWFGGRHLRIDVGLIENSLDRYPLYLSALIYVVLYVVVTFFIFFSKDVFWLAGALFFGPILGTAFICAAETVNAFILFFLARRFGRAYVEKRLSEKYRRLDEKLGRIDFFWLFIFRAAPLIPYRFMDLAAGLTSMDFRKYLLACAVGSPVKMFWIEYILYGVGKSILRDPGAIVTFFLNNQRLMYFSLLYVVLIIMVIFKIRSKD